MNYSDPSGTAYQGIYQQFNYNEHDHTYGGLRSNFIFRGKEPPVFESTYYGAGATSTATIWTYENVIISDLFPISLKVGGKEVRTLSASGDLGSPVSFYANLDTTSPVKSSSAGIMFNHYFGTLRYNLAWDDCGIYGVWYNGDTTNSLGVKMNLSNLNLGIYGSSEINCGNIATISYFDFSVNGFWLAAAYAFATMGEPISGLSPIPAPG